MRRRLNPIRALKGRIARAQDQYLARIERLLDQRLGASEKRTSHELKRFERLLDERLEANEKRIAKRTARDLDRLKASLTLWHRSVQRRVTKVEELLDRENPIREEEFYAAATTAIEGGRTMLGYEHLHTLWLAARNVAGLGGAWAEVGTYHGGTAEFLLDTAASLGRGEVEFHGFDLFDSPPPAYVAEDKQASLRKKSKELPLADVEAQLERFPNVTLHAGDVVEKLAALPERDWSLVHVDVNFREPTLAALRYFGQRLVPGGVLVLDDYREPSVPGVAEALDEWLAESGPGWQRWEAAPAQLVLVRVPAG